MAKKFAYVKRENAEKKAADLIEAKIAELAKKQPSVVFGICGGTSVPGVFAQLKERKIKWDMVHIFMVDERMVPLTHEESNYRQAEENFISELMNNGLLPRANVHPFVMDEAREIDYGTHEYTGELAEYGGFDIVLLSSGSDGHVAALFPKHQSIESAARGFIVVRDPPKPPMLRMSASRSLLQEAKMGILLFLGSGKVRAYKGFQNPKTDVLACPAKIVDEMAESYVVTDMK